MYLDCEEYVIKKQYNPFKSNEKILKSKVKEAIENVVIEYQENDNLDCQDENKVEWTPIHWFMRLKKELGIDD